MFFFLYDITFQIVAGDLIEFKDTLGQDCLEVATYMEHKDCARKLFLFQVYGMFFRL